MIAKGTCHNNGARLARYMTSGKDGERAELWQLSGFAASDIRDAFRSVHVMADATRCENPFFHLQVRNPEGEELTREQWRQVADRVETKLGLTDQPRAICFHVDETTGHEHMHVAWSRIDSETMRAVPLPFFKERLKEVCRELENTLDLTRVKSERDGSVLAPTRDEFEQARRLGIDIKDVRQTIRDCFERSDNGRSFEAALSEHGWVLAQGDRRAFVVIDHEGGLHALGRRVLGVTAAETRDRLADLDRDQLPSVEQARSFVREQQVEREKGVPVMGDPHRDEMSWQDALANAAIEKEKVERRFVEPGREEGGRKGKRGSPFAPPKIDLPPSLNKTAPEFWFSDVAREATRDGRPEAPPDSLRGTAERIWTAYNQSPDANRFAAALNEQGIILAAVTKEEADRSYRENCFAKEIGRFAPAYRDNEIVAITEQGQVYRLSERVTGDKRAAMERFLAPLDRTSLQGIDATKQAMRDRAEQRGAAAQLISLLSPVTKPEKDTRPTGRLGQPSLAKDIPPPAMLGKAAARALGKTLDVVGNAVESFFAPLLTPEQKRDGAQTTSERAADARETIDLSRYLAAREQGRTQPGQEREAERERERDPRER